jgi:hypothetical protein
MSLSNREFKRLRKKCSKLDDGPDYRCDNYVENLMLTAIDFQLDAERVVNPAIHHFRKKYKFSRLSALKKLLAAYPNTRSGNQELAIDLWGYRLWTRAKFLRVIVSKFEREGVRTQKGLKQWLSAADFDEHVRGRVWFGVCWFTTSSNLVDSQDRQPEGKALFRKRPASTPRSTTHCCNR